jgi:hypothetical protein
MKTGLMLALDAGIAGAGTAQQPAPKPEPLRHVETRFNLMVHASYLDTAPLFGASGERAWAGANWNPDFIFPLPEKDVEGAVFTVSHGARKAVWVNTLFDMEAKHFQYVYFLPDIMVTVIDVRFKSPDARTTAVTVVYQRTAITSEGNEHVEVMSEGDRNAGKDWQQAIDSYHSVRKQTSTP